MPLKLYLRNGVYHYRGTIGPAERRARLRGSCFTADKDIASRQISEIETNYWKGHFDGPGSILTFRQAADIYTKSGRGDKFLPPVVEYLGDTLIKDIKPSTLKQMAVALFPDNGGASRNRRAITPAQSVINLCAESELCSPIRVKGFKEEENEKTPADLPWVQDFRREANDYLGADALFMFLTGARPSESLDVQPEDLDLNRARVRIRQTKVSREGFAHLPPMLVSVIANLPRIEGRGVFGYYKYGHLYKTWMATTEQAKVERLTPHCCRHGFATELLRRGVDVVTVAWLGRWASPAQVLKTYGHALRNRTLTNVLVDADLTRAVGDMVESARQIRTI